VGQASGLSRSSPSWDWRPACPYSFYLFLHQPFAHGPPGLVRPRSYRCRVILVIDNYDSFTWNLVQGLAEVEPTLDVDRDVLVVRSDRITTAGVAQVGDGAGPTHIIISPGPCTPTQAGASNEIILAFAGRVPILGVCLGHQCLASAYGLSVARHAIQMHGKTSEIFHDGLGVFAGLPNPFVAARYHSLVVVPESNPAPGLDGWQVSAWTFDGGGEGDRLGHGPRKVVMGLRRVFADPEKFPVEGVQFHPESFLTRHGPRVLKNFLDTAGARIARWESPFASPLVRPPNLPP
jgi:anthranilate synthase/aminodeoxychorismate synthase-like glutamine amidotransferase